MKSLAIRKKEFYNPLDIVETVIMDRDWVFDRLEDGELLAEATGQWCKFQIWFAWQEEAGGLTLASTLDAKFPPKLLPKIHSLLAMANEKLWLGHYTIDSEDMTVSFRHSSLIREGAETSMEQLNDLLDIAIEECERFYPALQSVIWGGKDPAEALAIAMFETVAEA